MTPIAGVRRLEPQPALGGPLREFAEDVRRDLQLRPRQLQAKYFYDALGSQLFEAICDLPWYRIPSAERALLERHAEAIGAALPDLTTLVELGCGSGAKLALLVERMRRARPMLVRLVDISPTALELSGRRKAPCSCCSSDRTSATSITRPRRRSFATSARICGRVMASCSAPTS
jgi:hypothetical protein